MKLLIKGIVFASLLTGAGLLSQAQDRTEICRGSGYHCMDVVYSNGLTAKFVKGKNEPGAVIIEKETPKTGT